MYCPLTLVSLDIGADPPDRGVGPVVVVVVEHRPGGLAASSSLPGIFEDHDLVGPEDDALQEMARSMRQNGTRSRRARAASQPGSQHVELAAWRGWVEAVLDQPAGGPQAS